MNGATLFNMFTTTPDIAPLFVAVQVDVENLKKTPVAPDPAT